MHSLSSVHELLHTKLTPPRLRMKSVSRAALLARLDEGTTRKLTLLSAHAGFGKTTLVSEWIASRGERGELPPIAWLSLDKGDNDPVRFWRYVLTACQTFDAFEGETTLTLLHAAQEPSFETILTAFINEMTRLPSSAVLILDDYHVIHSQQVHEAVTFLLDYLPVTLHLIMLTRRDPPLPLARLRARDDIFELRADDLRFTQAEVQSFLQQNVPFSLTPTVMSLLEDRTEGWVTGLQLVTLALQRRQQPQAMNDFLETFSGSHRHILDYLTEEVLTAQPDRLQDFLLQTSYLSHLTASLCDAVRNSSDSHLILEQIEQANLFLIPLDAAQQWYRYHSLFAEATQEVARRRLGEAELCELYERASLWYEQNDYLADAIEMALLANSFARAAVLIELVTRLGRSKSELHTLRRWLEQLPEDILHKHPILCMSYAVAILFTSDRSAPNMMTLVEKPLQIAEQSWQADESESLRGQLFAFRSMLAFWQGDFARAFATAGRALALLPEHEFYWRGNSLLSAALEKMFLGRMNDARRMLQETRTLCEVAGNGHGMRAATFLLSEVCIEQGELQQAAQLYGQILKETDDDFFDQGHALTGLATLAYEWNELEKAETHVSQALQMGREQAETLDEGFYANALIVPASLLLARVEQARGQIDQARDRLQSLHGSSVLSPLQRLDAPSCQIRFALAAGDMGAVERWHSTMTQEAKHSFPLQQERQVRISARVMIAKGEAERVHDLLAPWQVDAQVHGRIGSEVEILILTALAHFAQDNLPRASEALTRALTLAQPSEYQRLFLDEGERMAALLQKIYPDVRKLPLSMYVRTLLLAFAEETLAPLSPLPANGPVFIEPLSSQEERVIRMLAAGLSNPEIAQELIVSINTVKTQVQSIYRKLDVHSREEARDAARHLGLA